jgi:hypothetical protein
MKISKKYSTNLKDCQKSIHKINFKKKRRDNDLPIQMIQESFALCSGAFYQLDLYHRYYNDLFDSSKNTLPHDESWVFFKNITNFKAFETETHLKSKLIKSEFRSMCIANAAFRLPSAGFLISVLVNQLKNNKKYFEITDELKASWKYHNCLKDDEKDWSRSELRIINCKDLGDLPNRPCFFLALLVCVRDEYGHSEYHEGHKCRYRVVDKYYREHIVNAEIIFLQETIDMILQLCQYHPSRIDLSNKIM